MPVLVRVPAAWRGRQAAAHACLAHCRQPRVAGATRDGQDHVDPVSGKPLTGTELQGRCAGTKCIGRQVSGGVLQEGGLRWGARPLMSAAVLEVWQSVCNSCVREMLPHFARPA
eukprot:365803-Chlamydomonas_euryale.AAC.15